MTKILDVDGMLVLADDLNMGLIWAEASLSELVAPPDLDDEEPALCIDCGAPAVEGEDFCSLCLARVDAEDMLLEDELEDARREVTCA